jgi:hypothetical protein
MESRICLKRTDLDGVEGVTGVEGIGVAAAGVSGTAFEGAPPLGVFTAVELTVGLDIVANAANDEDIA